MSSKSRKKSKLRSGVKSPVDTGLVSKNGSTNGRCPLRNDPSEYIYDEEYWAYHPDGLIWTDCAETVGEVIEELYQDEPLSVVDTVLEFHRACAILTEKACAITGMSQEELHQELEKRFLYFALKYAMGAQ